jgi:ABC-2 type transport system ATP-binding protein
VVLTTHYMQEAERLCDRVAVVDHGRIVALDTPARLIAEHAPGTTVEFTTANPVDADSLRSLPGVGGVDVDGDRVSLTTLRPEAVLARIFDPAGPWAAVADAGGVAVAAAPIRDLGVHGGTLEDVFLNLTGNRLRS